MDLLAFIELFLSSPEIPEDEKPHGWLESIFHSKIPEEFLIPPEYLLALLYHKVGNYNAGYKKMDDLFNRCRFEREEKKYLFAFRDALFLLSKKYKAEEIENRLSNYYHQNCVSAVMAMLTVKDLILMTIKSPKPVDYEYYQKSKSIFDKLKQEVKNNSINQYEIRDYFR